MKYTKYWLKKVEALLEAAGYTILYEKGNFQSGYCIVENRKVAVVNKYFDTEGRINCLLEILSKLELEVEALPPKEAELYQKLDITPPPPLEIDSPESTTPEEIDSPESIPSVDSPESTTPLEIDSPESTTPEPDEK